MPLIGEDGCVEEILPKETQEHTQGKKLFNNALSHDIKFVVLFSIIFYKLWLAH